MYIEVDWADSTEDTDFCATCYGASKTFYLRDEKSLYEKDALLRLIYASKAEQGEADVNVENYESKGSKEIVKHKQCFAPEGYGFIHIVNGSKDATFKEKVNYNSFQGLTMCKPQ